MTDKNRLVVYNDRGDQDLESRYLCLDREQPSGNQFERYYTHHGKKNNISLSGTRIWNNLLTNTRDVLGRLHTPSSGVRARFRAE